MRFAILLLAAALAACAARSQLPIVRAAPHSPPAVEIDRALGVASDPHATVDELHKARQRLHSTRPPLAPVAPPR